MHGRLAYQLAQTKPAKILLSVRSKHSEPVWEVGSVRPELLEKSRDEADSILTILNDLAALGIMALKLPS